MNTEAKLDKIYAYVDAAYQIARSMDIPEVLRATAAACDATVAAYPEETDQNTEEAPQ